MVKAQKLEDFIFLFFESIVIPIVVSLFVVIYINNSIAADVLNPTGGTPVSCMRIPGDPSSVVREMRKTMNGGYDENGPIVTAIPGQQCVYSHYPSDSHIERPVMNSTNGVSISNNVNLAAVVPNQEIVINSDGKVKTKFEETGVMSPVFAQSNQLISCIDKEVYTSNVVFIIAVSSIMLIFLAVMATLFIYAFYKQQVQPDNYHVFMFTILLVSMIIIFVLTIQQYESRLQDMPCIQNGMKNQQVVVRDVFLGLMITFIVLAFLFHMYAYTIIRSDIGESLRSARARAKIRLENVFRRIFKIPPAIEPFPYMANNVLQQPQKGAYSIMKGAARGLLDDPTLFLSNQYNTPYYANTYAQPLMNWTYTPTQQQQKPAVTFGYNQPTYKPTTGYNYQQSMKYPTVDTRPTIRPSSFKQPYQQTTYGYPATQQTVNKSNVLKQLKQTHFF